MSDKPATRRLTEINAILNHVKAYWLRHHDMSFWYALDTFTYAQRDDELREALRDRLYGDEGETRYTELAPSSSRLPSDGWLDGLRRHRERAMMEGVESDMWSGEIVDLLLGEVRRLKRRVRYYEGLGDE